MKPRSNSTVWLMTVMTITVLMGSVSWMSLRGITENTTRVENSHLILETLQSTLLALDDVETGTRGYVITGQKEFLEPYNKGLILWKQSFDLLTKLTLDNPTQGRYLDKLEYSIEDRLEISKIIIQDRESSANQAVTIIKESKGKEAMDRIRSVIGQMQVEERNTLKNRTEEAEQKSQQLIILTMVCIFVYALGLSVVPMIVTKSKR